MTGRIVLQPTRVPGTNKWTYTVDPKLARVLSVRDSVYEAHWDSGHPDTPAVTVTLWDGSKEWEEKAAIGSRYEGLEWTCGYVIGKPDDLPLLGYQQVEVNATDEDVARHAAYLLAFDYFRSICEVATAAHLIRQGEIVEVFKGRKVPKGRYEVVKHGEGQFGAYVDLRDDEGKSYRYVAVGNVKVVPNYAARLDYHARFRHDDEERQFLLTLAKNDFTSHQDWIVFAEWIESRGVLPGSLRGVDGDKNADVPVSYFAEYLDRLIASGVKNGLIQVVNEVTIARHNESRRLRY